MPRVPGRDDMLKNLLKNRSFRSNLRCERLLLQKCNGELEKLRRDLILLAEITLFAAYMAGMNLNESEIDFHERLNERINSMCFAKKLLLLADMISEDGKLGWAQVILYLSGDEKYIC